MGGGFPDKKFLGEIHPALINIRDHMSESVYTSDKKAGHLSDKWAKIFGLPKNIAISIGGFDCHMGAVGAGANTNDLVKVIGTSTCDILMVEHNKVNNKTISGICGQVQGSALPNLTT